MNSDWKSDALCPIRTTHQPS